MNEGPEGEEGKWEVRSEKWKSASERDCDCVRDYQGPESAMSCRAGGMLMLAIVACWCGSWCT
eukprot:scaffold14525_cov151-Isochrysis_galbana.AAC.2